MIKVLSFLRKNKYLNIIYYIVSPDIYADTEINESAKFHTFSDCSSLRRSSRLWDGPVR